MKYISALLLMIVFACTGRVSTEHVDENKDTIATDNLRITDPADTTATTEPKVYANERFKNVTVTRTGDNTFLIQGQGQIFEANFGWVIEDGHDELQTGHQMTDAGAPEWGKFSFTVTAPKKDPNSTLHIVLFESSAEDGSRQHELPVLLY